MVLHIEWLEICSVVSRKDAEHGEIGMTMEIAIDRSST